MMIIIHNAQSFLLVLYLVIYFHLCRNFRFSFWFTPILLANEVAPDLRDSSFVLQKVHVSQHPCQAHSRVAAGTVVHSGKWQHLKWLKMESGESTHIKGLLPGAKQHVLIAQCCSQSHHTDYLVQH